MNLMTNDILEPLGSDWFHRNAGALEVMLSKTTNTDVTLISFVDRRLSHYYNIEVCMEVKIQKLKKHCF